MRLGVSLVSIALTMFLAGCGGPEYGSVSGVITVNGTPLTQGVVAFHVEKGIPDTVSAGVAEGKYSIDKVPVGHAKISVQSLKPSGPSLQPDGTMSVPLKGSYIPLPDSFKDPTQSKLTYDVKLGVQEHSFDIKQ